MITGVSKAKCPRCGHEFMVMDGDFVYNPNPIVHCPECGKVIIFGLLSSNRQLRDFFPRKK